jgi:hypothetical protein
MSARPDRRVQGDPVAGTCLGGQETPKSQRRVDDRVTGPLNLRRHPKEQPVPEPWSDARLDEGLRLFNEGHHWHAHEALEPLWMGLEGDEKLFVQGIIMAAAMLVQYGKRVPKGVANHWENVRVRLRGAAPTKWGIDVAGLLGQLDGFALAAADGDWSLDTGQVHITRE